MNTVIMMGRLTKDPEIRFTATGMQVASFTLAVNRRFAKEEPRADFFKITAWNKTAEFVGKYFTKGQQVLVSGRLENRSWEDNTGVKRYATDVIAEEVYFADSKKEDKEDWKPADKQIDISDESELPF